MSKYWFFDDYSLLVHESLRASDSISKFFCVINSLTFLYILLKILTSKTLNVIDSFLSAIIWCQILGIVLKAQFFSASVTYQLTIFRVLKSIMQHGRVFFITKNLQTMLEPKVLKIKLRKFSLKFLHKRPTVQVFGNSDLPIDSKPF